MNQPQPVSTEKLRIVSTALLAVNFVIGNIAQLVGFIVQWFLLAVGIFAVIYLIDETAVDNDALASIVAGITAVPIVVAVHRAIILNEPLKAATYFPSFLHSRIWRFLGCLALVMGGGALIISIGLGILDVDAILSSSSTGAGQLFGLLVFLGVLFGAMAFMYLHVFIFPAIATDEFQSLGSARELMLGSTWRIFWCLLLIVLPFNIIIVIAETVQNGGVRGIAFGLSLLSIPMYPAAISFAYKHLTGRSRY